MEKDCKAYRDCTLLQVSESDIGKELKIAGWIENIRDHGGVSFVDIRDMYGMLQVVMRDTNLLDGLNKEDCVSISGVMQQRDEETYNPKIPTGTIELVKERLNPDLSIEGVVFTMYDARTNLSLQVVENVKDNLQQSIYKTIIPRNIRLAEAPSHGLPINLYDAKSTGAESYMLLAEEVINKGE